MKRNSKLFYSYLCFLLIYICFTLLPKPRAATLLQYHISATTLRIIDVTLIVLLAAIWFAGFYGYGKLKTYSLLIKDGKDGRQVARLTTGVLLLVLWLPVSEVIASVLNYFAMKHIGFLPTATIIDNYVSLLLPLIGFIFIGSGAYGLGGLVKKRPTYLMLNLLVILVTYIGLVYYHLVAKTANRGAVYHLSIWLLLVTIIAPYIYMWFMGLLATYQLYLYSKKVSGVVYKRSWRYLGLGIGWLIIMSIVVQYLTTLNARLAKLSIYWLLVIIYTLLLVLAAGFVLIATGSRKLQKIEEV